MKSRNDKNVDHNQYQHPGIGEDTSYKKGIIQYHKEHKGTDMAFSVHMKEKFTAMRFFDSDTWRYREVGRFKTFDDAEEYLLSRGASVNYYGVKM